MFLKLGQKHLNFYILNILFQIYFKYLDILYYNINFLETLFLQYKLYFLYFVSYYLSPIWKCSNHISPKGL